MNAQAGDIDRGFLRQQEHLAPLPIPTGQPPQDLMNIIWRKNPVYLDIGSFAMGGGWMTLNLGNLIFIWATWLFASTGQVWETLAFIAFSSALMGTLWYLFIKQWRKPLTPPLRFNRQRREVCVTEPDGNYWFVPWERVHAVSPSALSLNTGGASKQGVLILWLPLEGQEYEAYSENKPGWLMMLNTGGGMGSMAQWECIRSFMEISPEAVPGSSAIRNEGMSVWESYLHDIRQAAKSRGWLLAILWEGFFGLLFNTILLEHLQRKKLAQLPDLTAPEAVEWSKPLPPEQWAKRSPELERAIAEREAELAASSAA
ncbi:hypothetical protein [Ectopseudomonas guguanensis]|jgi:hypothetical protein|uniref:Uncharacterized protein n=1 Tax=Ectopseudomonas guguanensis TaxID=1198456 RepID=A0A1H0N3K0_9GAMM|nr:hypothetical protein [Pseudomonas guguanensis]SDO87233.1 hypothetical protein SAMN05216213_102238 [Pseudomonas guguanensis]